MAEVSAPPPVEHPEPPFVAVQAQPEFAELRRRLRAFVYPMTVAFLAWYLLYVLCSAFARDFMAHKLIGNVNVGLVFGLLQFVSTFGIAYAYSRYARRVVDPLADQLCQQIDGGMR